MEKILQFGEGNFLRAFAEFFIQRAKDNGEDISVAICQPIKYDGVINALKAQNCKYGVYLRGRLNGEIINEAKNIDCVSRCINTFEEQEKLEELFISPELEIIISNTTEAGIAFDENDLPQSYPYVSFPAKLTVLLYKRFKNTEKGLLFLPVELIENNADMLKKCILKYIKLWNLGDEFEKYIQEKCIFCCTLVDRIVTGHIKDDADPCSVACEPFGSWIIQADKKAQSIIPFAKYSREITFCDSLNKYRERKVKILNGTHTMSVLCAYMSGFDIVRDMMNDSVYSDYINSGLKEIKSTIDLPIDELNSFANSVAERFNNPFIDHKLLDISLNSVSKFKARCLPSILEYIEKNNEIPKILTFSLAGLIAFYTHTGSDRDYIVKDNDDVLEFFKSINESTVKKVLSNKDFWGIDLTEINGFENAVAEYYSSICEMGITNAVKEVVYE